MGRIGLRPDERLRFCARAGKVHRLIDGHRRAPLARALAPGPRASRTTGGSPMPGARRVARVRRMPFSETSRSDVADLAARITGDAYAPGEAGYDEGRQGFVLGVDLRPAVVALPETAEDVVAIVAYAREHGLRIAPQATGHNAYPLAEGDLSDVVLVRTSRMRGVEIDAGRKVARVEAGAWWIDVSEPASELGLAALAGSSPDVGVVGYTLGGGSSWLVRKHGMGANSVVAIEVVTPDGRHVRADHQTEHELFWALRGGGGSFGVVTAIELRLFDLPEVYAGVLFFDVARSAEVLKAWRRFAATAPDEATSVGRILHLPDMEEIPEMVRGKSFVTVEVVYAGPEAEGAQLIAPLRELGPLMDTFATVPPVALSRLHMDPEGAVPAFLSDHLILDDGLGDATIDAFAEVAGVPGTGLLMYELRHVGGAAARTGDDHGVLGALPGEFLAFGGGMTVVPPLEEAVRAQLARVRATLSAHDTQQAYLNFTEQRRDPALFFGHERYARLQAIRAHVDPERRMLANHPVG